MKALFRTLPLLVLLGGLLLAGPTHSYAQNFQLQGGGGFDLAAGSGSVAAGIDLRAVFLFQVGGSGKLGVTPDFGVFFQDGSDFLELNGNVTYRLDLGRLKPYPLAGLSLAFTSGESSVGFNIGGGLDFELNDRLVLFPEIRGRVGDGNWFGFTTGLKYNFIQ